MKSDVLRGHGAFDAQRMAGKLVMAVTLVLRASLTATRNKISTKNLHNVSVT